MALDQKIEFDNESRALWHQTCKNSERAGHALRGIKEYLRSIFGLVGFLWLLIRLDLQCLLMLFCLKCPLMGLLKPKGRIS